MAFDHPKHEQKSFHILNLNPRENPVMNDLSEYTHQGGGICQFTDAPFQFGAPNQKIYFHSAAAQSEEADSCSGSPW